MNRVLITGFPRSGTTFVGSILATPATVAYLHEPLNPGCGLPAASTRFADLDRPECEELAAEMDDLLELRGRLRGSVYPGDGMLMRAAKTAVRGRGPAHLLLARVPPRPQHVVIKDPFAMASIPWFHERGCTTLLLVRHPAAVLASFRRLGWRGAGPIRRFAPTVGGLDAREQAWFDEGDDLTRIALFWRLAHRKALNDLARLDGDRGQIVVHEALSDAPDDSFEALRRRTGLPTSQLAGVRLHRLTTGGAGAARAGGRAQQFRRASSDILQASLGTLSTAELDRVWDITGDVADRWYRSDGIR